jgi:hypothetical protein
MWLAYVDESYSDEFHWVIGLLVEHANVNRGHRAMREAMVRIENAFPVIDADEVELHGYEIFHGHGAFAVLSDQPRARVWIYNEAMTALLASEYQVILRGVSKRGLLRRYGDFADHPHRICMAHLIERIDDFCVDRDARALLVADEHAETQGSLLEDLLTYQERGTWGYRAKRITRVIDTIHFVPSFTNRLIQGADLAAFIARRFLSHEETDRRSQQAVLGLWVQMLPRIYHQNCWHP